jgi:hypothetical protein
MIASGTHTSCGNFESTSKNDESSEKDASTSPNDGSDTPTDKDNQNLDAKDQDDGAIKKDGDNTYSRELCIPAAESVSFETIPDVIDHINSLPLPLTIPCLIDSLPKPLHINATSSDLSVQPAIGAVNPRIFIFAGQVILTFAPVGKGSETVEFSEVLSETVSIKGELEFPVTTKLARDAAYTRIMRKDNIDGTTCVGCHLGETKVDDNIFETKALKPFDRQDVTLEALGELNTNCVNSGVLRCNIFDSLFRGAAPLPKKFPESMPTLF